MAYTTGQAKGLVALALVTSVGVAIGGDIYAGKKPTPRILLGATIAGVMLSGLAEVQPQLAAALALLAATSAVFVVGPSFFGQLGKSLNAPAAAAKAAGQ